jgi:hypothetical protein
VKSYITAALILILTLFSAGCNTYWYQEGKTIDECKQDHSECVEELKKYSSNWPNIREYELKFIEDCMRQKEYTPLAENELPLRVKREDPDRAPNWRLRGVAGALQ